VKIGSRACADQRGFTLAELLVAIAILGLIMLGVMTLLMTGNQSYLTGSNQAEAQAAVRAALERMTADIREAGYGPTTDQNCTAPNVPAGCFNAVTGPGGVGGPTATSFTLQADWDGSGTINNVISICVTYSWAACPNAGGPNNRGEEITYSIVGGTTLCRMESPAGPPITAPCPAPAGQPLITSVQPAISGGVVQAFFTYLDASGVIIVNPGANPWQIRTIWVQIMVGVQNQPPAIWQTGRVWVTMSDRIRLRNRI